MRRETHAKTCPPASLREMLLSCSCTGPPEALRAGLRAVRHGPAGAVPTARVLRGFRIRPTGSAFLPAHLKSTWPLRTVAALSL